MSWRGGLGLLGVYWDAVLRSHSHIGPVCILSNGFAVTRLAFALGVAALFSVSSWPELLAAHPRTRYAVTSAEAVPSAPPSSVRGARAVALARLDAAIHFFDPVAAAVQTPWDSLFAAHAPAVLDAPNAAAYRVELTAMLRGRGDALSALAPTGSVKWGLTRQQGVGVIAPASGARSVEPMVAADIPLVIDLRGGARLTEDALTSLIGTAPTPEQHALSYHGLPPATMQTSGGYGIEWRVARAATTAANVTRSARRIVVLADRASVLPASLLEGIAVGASVCSPSTPRSLPSTV